MLNRLTLIASSIATLIVAATLIAQPGQAQTAAQGAKKDAASECLSRPGGVAPRGSHWFYRIERPSGRRCWYLGAEGTKVRRATAAERKAAAAPSPLLEDEAPPLPRARERAERRSVATMDVNAVDTAPENNANATNTTANTADTNSVTASRFSAAWPAAANAAGASEREGATAAGNGGAEEPTTAEPQEAMPPVAPALAPADAAAAGLPSDPAPGVGHLLLFLSAVVAFIAIVVRSLLKLLSASHMQSEPRPAVQRAAPVIRTRSLERRASDHIGEPTTREGRPLRPLDIATRWDSVSRLPRTPSVPLYDDGTSKADAPLYADEGAALRRRRRVA